MFHGLGFWEWLRRVLNDRRDCSECRGWRSGVLIGEWGCEMRECCECEHYWEDPYWLKLL